jgi:hypothetical protein
MVNPPDDTAKPFEMKFCITLDKTLLMSGLKLVISFTDFEQNDTTEPKQEPGDAEGCNDKHS